MTDRRRAILILGMHRSGTSAVAGVASLLSGSIPKNPAEPAPDNPRGFWESRPLMNINNELLSAANSSWDDWKAVDEGRLDRALSAQFKERIKKIVLDEYEHQPFFVVKDPRICRLVPFYCSLLRELGIQPMALLPIRNPLEVAYSLARRDGFSIQKSLTLWLRHTLDAEWCSREVPRYFLNYERFLKDWRPQMCHAALSMGFEWPEEKATAVQKAEEFLTSELHIERVNRLDYERHPEVTVFVREVERTLIGMINGNDQPAYRNLLDELRSKFNDACSRVGDAASQERLADQVSSSGGVESVLVQALLRISDNNDERTNCQQRAAAQSVNTQSRLGEANEQIRLLSLRASALENRIINLRSALETKAESFEKLSNELVATRRSSDLLEQTIENLTTSTTWRASEPFRKMVAKLPRTRNLIKSVLKIGYHARCRALFNRSAEIVGSDVTQIDGTAEVGSGYVRPRGYDEWVANADILNPRDRVKIREHIDRLPYQPKISVVMPVYSTPERLLREAIQSLQCQIYSNWELCIADDASPGTEVAEVLRSIAQTEPRLKWLRSDRNRHISAASNLALSLAEGEFVALMDHDDILPEQALYEVVAALNLNSDYDMLYSDEDQIDASGQRTTPYFKTDWNIDLILGHNMVSHLGVYRRSLIEKVGGFREGYEGSQDYDLALRCADETSADRICHIPAVLYHWRRDYGQSSFSESRLAQCADAARRAIADHLERRNEGGRVVQHPMIPSWTRVIRNLPTPAPKVSLVIPTRDRADMLQMCLDGLMHRTDYAELEILVVDNQSELPDTFKLFREVERDRRVRILSYADPFNYSAINNMAVAQATGSIVGLINNDIDVISRDWLTEMVSLAVLDSVGAVGAKLMYPDGFVQHGGVVLGVGGVANHFNHRIWRSDPGYFGRNALTSSVSAVTGACLVIRKSVYEEVGGLNEKDLTVAFNDVDFCLRVGKKGYRNVWTPHAQLFHHESISRGADSTPEKAERFGREVRYMLETWGDELSYDPFYNENFSRDIGSIFELALPGRRRKPWLE